MRRELLLRCVLPRSPGSADPYPGPLDLASSSKAKGQKKKEREKKIQQHYVLSLWRNCDPITAGEALTSLLSVEGEWVGEGGGGGGVRPSPLPLGHMTVC